MTRIRSHAAAREQQVPWIVKEIPLIIALCAGVAILGDWHPSIGDGMESRLWFFFLVACILASSFRAMMHAESLAHHFGEPIGTVILTLSAITIEVAAVCALMLGAKGEATVARDAMFAVLMIILNLLVGIVILVGAWKRTEAKFNLQSAGNYLSMIVVLATLTLILPRFTRSEPGGWMSDPMEWFVSVAGLGIYIAFLWMQSSRHREFFEFREAESDSSPLPSAADARTGVGRSVTLLVFSLIAVVLLAEGLAPSIHGLLATAMLPAPMGGVFIAALILAPEALAAVSAARKQDMQRSINVLLGSALATIGLTFPAVMVVRRVSGQNPEFGLESPYIVLLVATLFLASFNLTRGRVNVVHGFIHLLLFFTWIVVILDEVSITF